MAVQYRQLPDYKLPIINYLLRFAGQMVYPLRYDESLSSLPET